MLVVKHTIATQQEGVLTVPWGLQFMVATRILGSQGTACQAWSWSQWKVEPPLMLG